MIKILFYQINSMFFFKYFKNKFKIKKNKKIKAVLKAYNNLKNSSNPNLIAEINHSLSKLEFPYPKIEFKEWILGSATKHAEISLRQYLISTYASNIFSKKILLAFGSSKKKFFYPLPSCYLKTIENHGISVAFCFSKILFGFFIFRSFINSFIFQFVIIWKQIYSDNKSNEKYVKFVGNYLLRNKIDDLKNLDNFISKGIIDRITNLISKDFIRIEYSKAIELLNNSNIKIEFGEDLNSEAENFLTEYYENTPVFVTNWPISIKSFYMKQNDDNITCANFDLLMPYKVGELIGGSMREENLNKLLYIMKVKNLSPEPLSFYLDLRKFGTVPHGGFGLGLDRLCMLFTNIENIKDVVPFPNSYQNCKY
jgi:hypothetical protein